MAESLDKILERAAVGIAQLDTNGRYTLVNERYCELLGRAREELLASRMQDFIHADDLPASLDAFIRAIESGSSLVVEQRHVRRGGSTVWISNSVSVGHDAQDGTPYVLAVAQDITARKATERALNQTQADLRLLLDSAAGGFYTMDRNGLTTLCNAAFLRMLGLEREQEVIGKDCHELIHHSRADGSHYPGADCPIQKAARSGVPAHAADEVFFRRDGSSFPVEYWVRPIVREGEIQGAVCTFVDLSERRNAEARQDMMNRELAHRVKNTLAIVQAIVAQTLRAAARPHDAVGAINARLVALGNAHSVLLRTRWGNAAIMDVVEGAITAHRGETRRIQVKGPRVEVGTKAALSITMALHELCTNAAKYGALSGENGSVAIEWSVTGGAADARLHLTWKERGGPPVEPPTSKGFGSRLIAESIGSDLRGAAELIFDPEGVRWSFAAPLTALKE